MFLPARKQPASLGAVRLAASCCPTPAANTCCTATTRSRAGTQSTQGALWVSGETRGGEKKRSHEQHSAGADKRSEPGERVAPSETLRGTLKVVPRPNSQHNRPDPDSRQPPTPSPPLSASWIERGEQQRPCVTRLPLSTCLAASVHGEVSQRRDRSHRAPRSAIPFHEDNLCRLQEPRWKLEKQQEKREKSAKSPTAS